MKKLILLFFVFATAFSGCNKDDIYPDVCQNEETDGKWLENKLDSYKRNNVSKVIIEQATYKGDKVFIINGCVGCADSMTEVYDCYGEVICQFGGIAGLNTCPDFDDNTTDKIEIYSN